ncbi:YtxH domain-containing protein [filamentous cyanobacterium LEGE 11480]|uniref:YtxH domain-containing protein n=1 Tax=Romeriopsis navalis LEGE 11480 TaxID=2777977 RepID=A0A928VS51_9CYAN|nr:YtxH domain-containing protein [Romeriopsis navalis]MBE9031976.1 YtxH domain-containing protein [Romeriopsis navalis LEGE 11480]
MSGKRSGAFVVGMMLGAAAGAIAGLVSAPRTGQETRRILKKTADALPDIAEDLSSTVQLQADRLSETAIKNWDGTLVRLKDAISAGVEATREAQQNGSVQVVETSVLDDDDRPASHDDRAPHR